MLEIQKRTKDRFVRLNKDRSIEYRLFLLKTKTKTDRNRTDLLSTKPNHLN